MRSPTSRIPAAVALLVTATLALAACEDATGPEPSPEETTITDEPAPKETTVTEESEPDPDGMPEDRSGDDEGTGPDDGTGTPQRQGTDPVPDAELPGEDFGLYFNKRVVAHVVGVEDGDVLFVRALPDHTAEEVGRLAPTDEAMLAGRERSVEHGLWAEIELADGVGWVNSRYLGYLALPGEDITSDLADYDPQVDAMALVADIAQARVELRTEETEATDVHLGPEWTLIQTPEDSPLYRVDVLPLPDDSVYGERLEIHFEDTGGGVAISQVQSIPICSRGVTDASLCT